MTKSVAEMSPEEVALNNSALKCLRAHFLPLRVETWFEGRLRTFIYSGFVISVENAWFLITAGHVIEEIRNVLTDNRYSGTTGLLLDKCSSDSKYEGGLPYALTLKTTAARVEFDGYDYGMLPISEITKLNLTKNGIEPIDEQGWDGEPPGVSGYWLLGVPREFCEVADPELPSSGFSFINFLNAVDRLPGCPPGLQPLAGRTFYGHIKLSEKQTSIVGMSGGPIFGAYNHGDGTFTYWVEAIQSYWDPKARNIAGCSARSLGIAIRNKIREIQKVAAIRLCE